jgi:hypothetical protein
MVLWMCGGVAQRAAASSPEDFIDDRERWYRAALKRWPFVGLPAGVRFGLL